MLSNNVWATRLKDAILDNSAIREKLVDVEAEILINWGMHMAEVVTNDMPLRDPDNAELRYEELYDALPKLMTRVAWVAAFRAEKDSDWTLKTLAKINELNLILHGMDAPQLSEIDMLAYATQADGLSRGDFIQELLQKLSQQEPPQDGEEEEIIEQQ